MKRLNWHARTTMEKLFGLPQGLAFLPACTLAAFWIGGESALIIAALLVPLAYSVFGPSGRETSSPPPQDSVTGLLLRDSAIEALDTWLDGPDGRPRPTAAIVLAVEGLNEISQRYGLPSVDFALRAVAERISSALRQNDVITRAEGNCFAIALAPMRRADLETLLQIAARLQEAVREPVSIDATTAYVTSSVGFCLSSRTPSPTGAAMVKAAETAMLEARLHGPGAIRAFSSDMQAAAKERSDLIDELAEALDCGQVRPFFQPQISSDTGAVTGFEALVRWHHPERGLVTPDLFLRAADQAGLSARIGEEVLYHSLSALRSWDKAGLRVPSVGVNFSQDELRDPHLAERIAWELDKFSLEPGRLTVEILETVVADSPDDVIVRNIRALAELGCHIDLDDFGTGQAAISSVRRFPINRLKIDRSFVTKVDRDPDQRDMVAAILTMAERLKLETVAEGVETVAEHAMLAQLGCDHVQGFGVARPMPFEDTIGWIEAHNRKLPNVTDLGRKTG